MAFIGGMMLGGIIGFMFFALFSINKGESEYINKSTK
jgi:gas vesicle protein